MRKPRFPRVLAFVALGAGAAGTMAATCQPQDSGACVASSTYDDGGVIPPDAGIVCPAHPDKNGNCPPGCQPIV